jgi:chromosome segregation ATPase
MEKFAAEKDNLEARLKEYEQDYEELNKLRNKSLEDIGSAIEAQKKAEAENRALQDGIHKLKRDLELQTETMATLRQDKDLLESAAESGSGASEEQELRLINLQQQVEKLEAQNQLVIKQKEQLALTVEQLEQSKANQLQASKSATTSKEDQRRIKELVNKAEKYEEEIASLRHSVTDTKKEFETLTDDNKKLNAEYEKLLEAHRSVENECLKLMDEVERLHSEGLMGLDANIHDGHDGANNQEHKEDPRLIVLQKQYAEKQTQLDRITVQHTAQLREVQQKLNDLERNKQREVHALNKDIAELESLIESKIFKEADLEEAVESERKTVRRLRDELSDLKNQLKESSSAKTNGKTSERKSSTTTSTSLRTPPAPTSNTANKANDTNDTLYCEICEQHGHDIISCTALLSDADYAAEEKRVSNSVNTDRDRPVRVVTEEVLWSFCI